MDEELNVRRAEALRFLADRSHDGWSSAGDGAVGVFTGVESFTSNGVITTRPGTEPKEVERLAGEFAGLSSVPWSVQFGPNPTREESELARRLGLDRTTTLPTMTLDLRSEDFSGSTVVTWPKAVAQIRQVRAHDALQFGEVVSRAFDLPPSQAAQLSSMAVICAPEVTALWAVDAAGIPIATGMSVSLSGTHTGLFAIGTVRGARRRGVGAALTSALLSDAWGRGSQTAFLQASPMGRPVYAALGFRVAEELTYFF